MVRITGAAAVSWLLGTIGEALPVVAMVVVSLCPAAAVCAHRGRKRTVCGWSRSGQTRRQKPILAVSRADCGRLLPIARRRTHHSVRVHCGGSARPPSYDGHCASAKLRCATAVAHWHRHPPRLTFGSGPVLAASDQAPGKSFTQFLFQ